MRIAMIGQKGMPAHYGGVEQHVHNLALQLNRAGHEVFVYSRKWYTQDKKNTVEGVKLVYTPSLHTKHLDTITHTLTATLHAVTQNFDIIHYHGVGPALLSWLPRLFCPQTKVITTFHSIDRYHQKWGRLAKFALRLGEWAACKFAHQTITVSQSLHQYCLNEFGQDTTYIPNGVVNKPLTEADEELRKFSLEKNKYLVMISRLVPHKGAHLLIEAFHNLKAHYPDNTTIQELKLAIVGGAVYTDDYVRQLHLQASNVNDIVFTDFQTGKALDQLYANALALVHPSLNEGLPITVLQAMSHARPALVSTIPEHLELIQEPQVLFRENNVSSLENCLYKFLNLAPERQKQIGKKNHQVIDKHYSWDVVAPQVIDLYKLSQKKVKKPAYQKLPA